MAADGRHVEENPQEQVVLAEIRRLRGEVGTLRGIAASLNRSGFRTRCGSDWRLEHEARILKSEAFATR